MPGGARSGACEACGADATAGAAHRQRSYEEATDHLRQARRHHTMSELFGLGAGLACLTVGVMLLVLTVRSERPSFIFLIGAIGLGVVLTVRGTAHLRALWRTLRFTERDRAELDALEARELTTLAIEALDTARTSFAEEAEAPAYRDKPPWNPEAREHGELQPEHNLLVYRPRSESCVMKVAYKLEEIAALLQAYFRSP